MYTVLLLWEPHSENLCAKLEKKKVLPECGRFPHLMPQLTFHLLEMPSLVRSHTILKVHLNWLAPPLSPSCLVQLKVILIA